MRIPERLTGAELATLRESCNLSRDELAQLVGVQARTVKHWENGRAGVPADVATTVAQLHGLIDDAVRRQVALFRQLQATMPGPPSLALLRYRTADDMAMHNPELAGYPESAQAAIAAQLLHVLPWLPGGADASVRVIWMDPPAYDAWRQAQKLADDPATRASWAATQVHTQDQAHRADQPPPA